MYVNLSQKNHADQSMYTDSTATTFQPFFLDFHRVHSLATHFFIRMWSESGATKGDFPRIVALVHSQYVCCSVFDRLYLNLFPE